MEENMIHEGNLEDLEVASETPDESIEVIQDADSELPEVIVTDADSTSDLIGKLIFAAGATVVGSGIAYITVNRKKIKKQLAEKSKAKAEKKLAKQAAKIKKANEVIESFNNLETISEDCEAATITTAE